MGNQGSTLISLRMSTACQKHMATVHHSSPLSEAPRCDTSASQIPNQLRFEAQRAVAENSIGMQKRLCSRHVVSWSNFLFHQSMVSEFGRGLCYGGRPLCLLGTG